MNLRSRFSRIYGDLYTCAMAFRKGVVAILVAAGLFQLGISACRSKDEGVTTKTFLEMPYHEQEEFLRRQAPGRQVELFLAARWRQHPPNYGLAIAIAEQGERVLPFLMATLSEASDRRTKEVLLEIITLMQRRSHHCVTCDADVVEVIGKELDELGYGPIARETFLELLRRNESESAHR